MAKGPPFRRVIALENPGRKGLAACVGWLYTGLQVMRPGEFASAHSHASAALRFVMAGHVLTPAAKSRRIGGQWAVSRVALAMYLDGNLEALRAYLRGDRSSSTIIEYFTRCNAPL